MSLTGGHLDALIDAGATAAQIVALVKADMIERETALEGRREKDRVRQQRRRHAESRGVTRTERDIRDIPPEVSPEESNQTPSLPPAEVSEAEVASSPLPRQWALPLGVSLQIWTDFLANRKRKRLGNTPTAWKAFQDDLSRVASQTGIPPPKLIEHAAAKGWGSINAPDEDNRNGSHIGSLRGPRPDPTLALVRAAAAAQREDRGDHGEARLALPSGKLG